MANAAEPGQPVDEQQQDGTLLHMDVQPHEEDCMAAIGYAHELHPRTKSCELAVSPRVSAAVASESIKMLFMFDQLQQLQLRFDFLDISITQDMVCAVAELLQLTSLQVLHGSLAPGIDVSHWSSLRSLGELRLLPAEEGGLADTQVEQLTTLSSSLTTLMIRPNPQATTTAGLWHLAGLSQLQQLSVCPLPESCSASELQQLLEMPQLTSLQLGTADAAQVLQLNEVRLPRRSGPDLALVVRDACEPGPAADVLTVISWQLPSLLTSLCIGPLAAACPNDVLVTLATLTRLQSLQLQLVAPPHQHSSGTLELLTLAPCRQLTCLEVLTSSRIYVPFSLKTVSLATLAWPQLAALRLSLAGKPELMPEALDMCDNFTALRELQLFSPLEDTALDGSQALQASACMPAGSPSSWGEWASAGLGGLRLFGPSSSGTSPAAVNHPPGLASSSSGGRSSGGGAVGALSSPLVQDVRQRHLVGQQQRQQHWRQHAAAHQQHVQQQQQLREGPLMPHTSHRAAVYTLEQQQRLPAAVGSFQHHKLMRADKLFGSGDSTAQQQQQQQAGLGSQGSGNWSPTWLLRSFAPSSLLPFGPAALPLAADAAAAAAGGSGVPCGQPQSTWSLLGACRGAAPSRTTSLDGSAAPSGSRQPGSTAGGAPSRLQYSSSHAAGTSPADPAGAGAIRRASTIGGAAGQELLQQVQATAAPGLDLAMYRAAGRLLPLNLNFLPFSLTKLCLESYHLVSIGMPEPGKASSPTDIFSTPAVAGGLGSTGQQQQQDMAEQQGQGCDQVQVLPAIVEGTGATPAAGAGTGAGTAAPGGKAACVPATSLPAAAQHAAAHADSDPQVPPTPSQQAGLQPGTPEPKDAGAPLAPAPAARAAAGSSSGCVQQTTSDAGGAAAAVASATAAAGSSQGAAGGQASAGGLAGFGGVQAPGRPLPRLQLPHLLHLELDSCRVEDDTLVALLHSSPQLRTLEIAGLEGLTDAGLSAVSALRSLKHLCVEAEATSGISMASMAAVCRVHSLKKLSWCSRDSLHGPMDVDLLTAQLSGLTGLRQLVLLVAPDSEAYSMSGWTVVLQRRLPLCRLVLCRQLVALEAWGDVPAEDVQG